MCCNEAWRRNQHEGRHQSHMYDFQTTECTSEYSVADISVTSPRKVYICCCRMKQCFLYQRIQPEVVNENVKRVHYKYNGGNERAWRLYVCMACWLTYCSVFVLAQTSVSSPRKLFVFIITKILDQSIPKYIVYNNLKAKSSYQVQWYLVMSWHLMIEYTNPAWSLLGWFKHINKHTCKYVWQHWECKNRPSSCNQKSHIRKQSTRPLWVCMYVHMCAVVLCDLFWYCSISTVVLMCNSTSVDIWTFCYICLSNLDET